MSANGKTDMPMYLIDRRWDDGRLTAMLVTVGCIYRDTKRKI